MKTRAIPSICMLAAGIIRCIAGVIYREEIKAFLWSLILVMLIFYIIGVIVKVILDKNFKEMEEDKEEAAEETELENIEETEGENEESVREITSEERSAETELVDEH